jgi:hypothetical protein
MQIACKNCASNRMKEDEENIKRRIENNQSNDKNSKKSRTFDHQSSPNKIVNNDSLKSLNNSLLLNEPQHSEITESESTIEIKDEIYDIQIPIENHDWHNIDNFYENNTNNNDEDGADIGLNQATIANNLINRPRAKGFNSIQKSELEKMFNNKKYISCEERTELSKRLNLTQVQIKDWFKNHRKIMRRTLEKKNFLNNTNQTNS